MSLVSIMSWNIQGREYRGTHTDFAKIVPVLQAGEFDIVCLQEMVEARARLQDLALPGYEFFVPPNGPGESYNHNIILSRYPILESEAIVFPASLSATPLEGVTRVDVEVGEQKLRVYNCHFVIDGAGIATRLRQLEYIIHHSQAWDGPVVICGDMNTTIPASGMARQLVQWWHDEADEEMLVNGTVERRDERELFAELAGRSGFAEAFDLSMPTWSPFYSEQWQLFQLKLDWFLVKNVRVVQTGMGEYISDHKSLLVTCSLK